MFKTHYLADFPDAVEEAENITEYELVNAYLLPWSCEEHLELLFRAVFNEWPLDVLDKALGDAAEALRPLSEVIAVHRRAYRARSARMHALWDHLLMFQVTVPLMVQIWFFQVSLRVQPLGSFGYNSR